MDSRQEILDAIQILIDEAMNNVTQIQNGTCTGVALKTCTMLINGRELDNIQFYGNTPIINKQYRVFIPNGNMNMAFIITGGSNSNNIVKTPTISIKVGTVTELPYGSTPTVTNSGTDESVVLDFGLPKGADSSGQSSATVNPYPIGSYYWSSVATNPKDLFGGEWEQIKDKFVLAAGDTYSAGGTGGEATHTLTINEMPTHHHRQRSRGGNSNIAASGSSIGQEFLGTSGTFVGTTEDTGEGGAHNNMPPYIVAYCWHRIG